jgi:hypothetical protein
LKGFPYYHRDDKSKYLIGLAFDNFPEWWLRKIYENVYKTSGKYASTIDEAFKFMYWRYYEYALAISLLLAPEELARHQVHDNALISIHGIERVNARVWESIT